MINTKDMASQSSKYKNILYLLPAILPAAVLIFLIVKYWVNVPYWDDWDYTFLFENFHNKTLSFADFFAQHNESREIFPKYIILLSGLFTKWDVRVYMGITYLLLCGMSFFIYRLLSGINNIDTVKKYVSFFLINLLVFTPAHWENLLWSSQFKCFIPGVILLAGLLINISKISLIKKLVYNCFLAVFATYSFANGMLLWILLIPFNALFAGGNPFKNKKLTKQVSAILIYGIIFITVLVIYFYNFKKPASLPPVTAAFDDLSNTFKFFFLYFSSPVFSAIQPVPQDSAPQYLLNTLFMLGAVIVGTYITCVIYILKKFSFKKILSRDYYPWIIIGAYSLFTGITTTLGRSGLGWWKAAPSKYAVFALFLPISMIPLTANIYPDLMSGVKGLKRKMISVIPIIFLVLFECFYIFTYMTSIGHMRMHKALMEKGKQALKFQNFVKQDGDVKILYPDIGILENKYSGLTEMGYLDFRPFDFSEFRISEDVNMDSKLMTCRLVLNKRLVVAGWARDPYTRAPAEDIILIAFGKNGIIVPVATITTGIYDAQKTEALGEHADAASMFFCLPNMKNLPPGDSTLMAFIVDNDNNLLIPIAGTHEIKNRPSGLNSL